MVEGKTEMIASSKTCKLIACSILTQQTYQVDIVLWRTLMQAAVNPFIVGKACCLPNRLRQHSKTIFQAAADEHVAMPPILQNAGNRSHGERSCGICVSTTTTGLAKDQPQLQLPCNLLRASCKRGGMATLVVVCLNVVNYRMFETFYRLDGQSAAVA